MSNQARLDPNTYLTASSFPCDVMSATRTARTIRTRKQTGPDSPIYSALFEGAPDWFGVYVAGSVAGVSTRIDFLME